MGAQSFIHSVKAIDVQQAWDNLIEIANYEDGHKSYNGSINTCDLGRCMLRFDKATKTNLEKAYKFIAEQRNGEKWVAHWIDAGVVEYQVICAKKTHYPKNEPVIRVKYVVREKEYGKGKPGYIKAFDTKKEADDFAMKLAIQNNKEYYTSKEGVLVSGNSMVSAISLERKVYASKPKIKDMANRKVVEIHQYIFYGWASC